MSRFNPSKHSSILEITGSKSDLLTGKRIVIGMTGSVAVLEIVNLARLLMRNGAEIFVVMSSAAMELIQPDLVEWAVGNPVITKLTGQIEHVHLCGQHPDKADLLLIAPSTANTIGKIAQGIDDTPVTTFATTAFGTGIPIAIVPAMHATMYENPMVVKNITELKGAGVIFIGPRIEEGKAKIAKNEEILEAVIGILAKNDLVKKKVVVTAGPTRIWIDDVRFISNPSTGKMGIEIAQEAASRGAEVTLILGPTTLSINNPKIKVETIETPQDIINVINKQKKIDVFISAAAIGDYQPEKQIGKIPSKKETLTLKLKPTPKIIAYVKQKFPKARIVGFKAEVKVTKNKLIEKAHKSLKEHQIDLVAANFLDKPDQGFGSSTNKVILIKSDGEITELPLTSKRRIAEKIIDEIISSN
ncbi:MAG: bifunctional phosphopantothenoylcysteine decarboxylase/phosphopantothenate--cysteine ligase CoaBC [Candidatus Heimdallarchaeota archaeon]|nr:MAG: bifunctional phosphopantothenoylcysteine decarboxylase/phosphopantothenate--cysteine ligase CoaBC [Candidatus Heimdallarchaeota archaeon]